MKTRKRYILAYPYKVVQTVSVSGGYWGLWQTSQHGHFPQGTCDKGQSRHPTEAGQIQGSRGMCAKCMLLYLALVSTGVSISSVLCRGKIFDLKPLHWYKPLTLADVCSRSRKMLSYLPLFYNIRFQMPTGISDIYFNLLPAKFPLCV